MDAASVLSVLDHRSLSLPLPLLTSHTHLSSCACTFWVPTAGTGLAEWAPLCQQLGRPLCPHTWDLEEVALEACQDRGLVPMSLFGSQMPKAVPGQWPSQGSEALCCARLNWQDSRTATGIWDWGGGYTLKGSEMKGLFLLRCFSLL